MLGLHFPALDHVTEFCDAITYEFLFVAISFTDYFPEIVCCTLLKLRVFSEFPELTDYLKFFLTNFF